MKPVINLDDPKWETFASGPFEQRYAIISKHVGAIKLGYNLTVVPPGKMACPFHNHRVNEEMFLILEGEGVLRFGEERFPLRPLDIIACPPGGREVAHQIKNTGATDLKYLSLSTNQPEEICEYPDSDKVGIFVGDGAKPGLRLMFQAGKAVDYMVGEDGGA